MRFPFFAALIVAAGVSCVVRAGEQPPAPATKSFDDVVRENERWMSHEFAAGSTDANNMVNEIVLTVSIVVQEKGGTPIGSASGFFYARGDNLFLVTNRHVMQDKDAKDDTGHAQPIIPDSLRLRLHTDVNDIRKNGEIDLPLYKDGKPLWKTHPKVSAADVALLKLDAAKLKKRFLLRAWSTKDFFPKNMPLSPGEDVFIMGYPLSFHDTANNLPIFRNAMIASAYRVQFQGLPLFLADANLHRGMSGSPVIAKPKNTRVDDQGNTQLSTGTTYYLLGIHSGTIDPKMSGGEPLGLGAAWYAELLEEIAAQF